MNRPMLSVIPVSRLSFSEAQQNGSPLSRRLSAFPTDYTTALDTGAAPKSPGRLKITTQNLMSGHAMHAEEKRLAALKTKVHGILQEMHRDSKKRMIAGAKEDTSLTVKYRDAIFELVTSDIHTQTENKKKVHKVESHMDFLTKQLQRRGQFANEQRQTLVQEIVSLNEQVRALREANSLLVVESKKKIMRGGRDHLMNSPVPAGPDDEEMARRLGEIVSLVPPMSEPVDIGALLATQDEEWKNFVTAETSEKHIKEAADEARMKAKNMQIRFKKEVEAIAAKSAAASKEAMKRNAQKLEQEREDARKQMRAEFDEYHHANHQEKTQAERKMFDQVHVLTTQRKALVRIMEHRVESCRMSEEDARSRAVAAVDALKESVRYERAEHQVVLNKYSLLMVREKALSKSEAEAKSEIHKLKQSMLARQETSVTTTIVNVPVVPAVQNIIVTTKGPNPEQAATIAALQESLQNATKALSGFTNAAAEAQKKDKEQVAELARGADGLRRELTERDAASDILKTVISQLEDKCTVLLTANENEGKAWRKALDHRRSYMTDLENKLEAMRTANAEYERVNQALAVKAKGSAAVTGFVADDLEAAVRSRTKELNYVAAKFKFQVAVLTGTNATKEQEVESLTSQVTMLAIEVDDLKTELHAARKETVTCANVECQFPESGKVCTMVMVRGVVDIAPVAVAVAKVVAVVPKVVVPKVVAVVAPPQATTTTCSVGCDPIVTPLLVSSEVQTDREVVAVVTTGARVPTPPAGHLRPVPPSSKPPPTPRTPVPPVADIIEAYAPPETVHWKDMTDLVSRAQKDHGNNKPASYSHIHTSPRHRSPGRHVTVTAGAHVHPSWSFIRGARSAWTQTSDICVVTFPTAGVMTEAVKQQGLGDWLSVLPCTPPELEGSCHIFCALTVPVMYGLPPPPPAASTHDEHPTDEGVQTIITEAALISSIESHSMRHAYDHIQSRLHDETMASLRMRSAGYGRVVRKTSTTRTPTLIHQSPVRKQRVVVATKKEADGIVFESPLYQPRMGSREPPALKGFNNPYVTMKGIGTARGHTEGVLDVAVHGWGGRGDGDPYAMPCTTHMFPDTDASGLPPPHQPGTSPQYTPVPHVDHHVKPPLPRPTPPLIFLGGPPPSNKNPVLIK